MILDQMMTNRECSHKKLIDIYLSYFSIIPVIRVITMNPKVKRQLERLGAVITDNCNRTELPTLEFKTVTVNRGVEREKKVKIELPEPFLKIICDVALDSDSKNFMIPDDYCKSNDFCLNRVNLKFPIDVEPYYQDSDPLHFPAIGNIAFENDVILTVFDVSKTKAMNEGDPIVVIFDSDEQGIDSVIARMKFSKWLSLISVESEQGDNVDI